ncbi:hypothetical protein VB776_06925 [Arcicella sp. DC2W]|uniref:DUF4435 domain-containing protein n=1 Tax=Arcicella gelida TaxID=2984195 RepID=A0ABU5S2E4_9BACT|nr:hypothetical protein [Arcicella sp. DC2W]MEA5402640.1 hypothetical protein [Arcicella sp. DC2W]
MRIEIKENIFNSNDHKKLDHLIRIVFERPLGSVNTKAKVFIDLNECLNSNLYEKLDSIDKELLEVSTKDYFYEDSPTINYTVSNDNNQESYTLEEAIALLNAPFWILLENSRNDQELIKSIIFNFDDNEEYLKDCLKNRWIEFDNAGGCGNVKNLLKQRINSFENFASIYSTNPRKYYRGIVILDSDKDFKTQTIKPEYVKLESFFQRTNIPYHILEKRAMENYMPDEVIIDILRNKSMSNNPDDKKCTSWGNLYQYLNSEQKDFLKYDGLDKFNTLSLGAQNLYRNLLPSNYNILVAGIHYRDNNATEDEEKRFKNAFPKLFTLSPLVNKASLSSRCGTNELEKIFNIIKQLL